MTLDFDIEKIEIVEFGVGIDEVQNQSFNCITVDINVQFALKEMIISTWDTLQSNNDNPGIFEASEKYNTTEYIYLPLCDNLAEKLKQLHESENLEIDNTILDDPSNLYCYFTRMLDTQGRRLTAIRRATQFKGVLKKRLVRLVTDALKIIDDKVFKLDNDFDLLIDSSNIHILRPSGFEFVCHLQTAILAAVEKNINKIKKDLPYVDFSSIQEFAGKHTRAARYLASIRSQDIKNTDASALRKLCKNTNVDVRTVKGKITVEKKDIMGFLEVLDRRRYEVTLVKGSPERFRAPSRKKLPRQ